MASKGTVLNGPLELTMTKYKNNIYHHSCSMTLQGLNRENISECDIHFLRMFNICTVFEIVHTPHSEQIEDQV